jgi:cation diffusion facilitator CzcD-associated flavoprotein CzcO
MKVERTHHRVIVIGAGIAGVGLGVRLLDSGIEDFAILERNGSVGGTWFEHTYPGCACDIPAHLYSYSFARNPRWTRLFPTQEEILNYVRETAERYGVDSRIRFGCEMLESSWDEADGRWHVRSNQGSFSCDVLVSAIGATAEPDEPDIPGLEDFAGHRFHSARWDHEHDLSGERVAVIGTGPAAAQFIPAIQPAVGRLDVFQRTPPWVIPHPDRPVPWGERQLYRLLPPLQDLQRNALFLLYEGAGVGFRGREALIAPLEALGRLHLRRQVSDPALRQALTPDYRFGCKRPILSNSYYPALAADNCELVTAPIERVDKDAVVTADGERRGVDTIITAIGYRYSRSLLVDRIVGRDGRTMRGVWDESPRAFLGATVPGFPNLFILLGPNSIGLNSVIFSLESQIAYVMDALRVMDEHRIWRLEVRREELDRYVGELDSRSANTVWTQGGCRSYYLDDSGRQFALYPGFATGFRRTTRRFDLDPYETATTAA